MSQQLLSSMFNHQSIRHYLDQPLTAEQVSNIERAVLQTSSSCFFQMVTTIRVTDRARLRRLAELAGNQDNIATCAEYWVFCLDCTKLMHAGELRTPIPFRFLYSGLNDVSLCCQQALVAAEAQGLGCVIIGGHKPGAREMTQMLKLPRGVIPALCLCIGVPDEEYREAQKPRLPRHWLIMENEFHDPYDAAELEAYNAQMRSYYASRRHGARDDDWLGSCRELLDHPNDKPQHLTAWMEYLIDQGYSLSF